MSAEQLDLERYGRQLAVAARDAGQRAVRTADPDGFEAALDAIRELASFGSDFDADDVRALSKVPLLGNATGAAFATARKAGWIHAVGFTTSASPTRHGGVVRRWRGADGP